MKRASVIIVILLAVAALVLAMAGIIPVGLDTKLAEMGLNPFKTATPQGQATASQEKVTVGTGTVSSYIKATGNLEARETASLSFEIDGTVADVYVKRGDVVEKGDQLAQLDTTELELAVKKAQIELDKAKAELAQTTAEPDEDDVTSAQAALESAQAAYDAVMAGQSEEEVTVAAAALRKAEVALQDAQWAYDKVAFTGDVGASSQAAALQEATIDYESALADYKMTVDDASEDEILSAVSQVASAQATLNNLLEGSTPQEITIAQAAVDTAQMALEDAQRAVEQATLVARFSGTITSVDTAAGERPQETSVIGLADLSALHIDVPVDEIDLPEVKVGQTAIVGLDALPDVVITGTVSAIAPSPDEDSTTVTYEVTVNLDSQDTGAVVGMTGNVSIETERRENVIVVPADMVAVDDATGNTYVNKVVDGYTEKTTVDLGLRDGDNIEVVSGLSEGDVITAAAITPTTTGGTEEQRGGMGFMMGGGGPPPGGGGGRPGGGGGGPQ